MVQYIRKAAVFDEEVAALANKLIIDPCEYPNGGKPNLASWSMD
jgi:hypothetical protein